MENFKILLLQIAPFYIEASLHKESTINSSLFPGVNIRGSLMMQMKGYFCVKKSLKEDCKECILRFRCNYSRLFETPRPQNATLMRKYPEIPHPFSLAVIKSNGKLYIRIVLFGENIKDFPFIYSALVDVGKKKGFDILSVRNMNANILKGNDISALYKTISIEDISPSKVNAIEFVTQLRMKFQNKLVNPSNFTLKKLMLNIVRRYKLLSYFYAGSDEIPDIRDIVEYSDTVSISESNLNWLELERYSMRKKQDSPIGGIVGNITISGNTEPLSQILKLGHFIQVGKNTSFGCGYYKIS